MTLFEGSGQPMEPLAPGWTYVRNREGVVPFAHLIQTQSSNGAVTTRCGQVCSNRLPTEGVVVMLRCPECDMDLQLD